MNLDKISKIDFLKVFKIKGNILVPFLFITTCFIHCTISQKADSSEVSALKKEIIGKTWKLENMVIQNQKIQAVSDSIPRLIFTNETISLVAYCHSIGGNYTLGKNGSFSSKIESLVQMSCDDAIRSYEAYLIDIVEHTRKIVKEKHLLLMYKNDHTVLVFKSD